MNVDGYCTLGVDREYDLTADALLRAMDEADVERAVIAPVDRCLAVHNREGTDLILEAAADHPDRFIATCTANPWYSDDAIDETRSAADDGARILVLAPALQGFGLGDELASALIEAATALDLPVYVHTGGYQFGTPAQLGLAAKRFPETTFIMGHCGSTDFKVDAVEVAQNHGNVFLEVSLARPLGVVEPMATLGDARLIMGSAAPLSDLAVEWREMREAFPPGEHPGFYGGTLLRLLGEPVP